MTIQITIIGLGQIGASLGLALKDHKDLVRRVGHDRESQVARQAEKLGAVDSISYNLPASIRQADLVVLTEPLDELYQSLEIVVAELHEGAVLMDTAPVKQGIIENISRLLPADRHYISLLPVINPAYLQLGQHGVEAARADLFHKGLMLIAHPSGANAEAIKLAADLTSLVGATPLFIDAAEADGLSAAALLLPQLTAAALVNATTDQPGWREARKIAGPEYVQTTAAAAEFPESKELGKALLLNRENSLRMLDALGEALADLRQAIAANDAEALRERLENARSARETWLKLRESAAWADAENPQPRTPSTGDVLRRWIGISRPAKGR